MRRPLQLALFAVVLLGLVGGLAAYFLAQKSLTLTVDGQSRKVTTYADTVGELLEDEGLRTASHDVVLPAPASTVGDGDTVVVNRARLLELRVDGVQKRVYVTARNVSDALDQLGYRGDDLVLSASRSQRLPLTGMQLSIATPKHVTLIVDGAQRVVTTSAATAADLLTQQGVTLGQDDTMSLLPTQALMENMRLQVFRVKSGPVTVTSAIPHKTVETPDPNAAQGQRTVAQKGVDGVQTAVFQVTVTDGVETARRQLSSTVTTPPVDELVTVGTKPGPAVTPTADGLNWAALAQCESGGNPRSYNPAGYYGLYQFSKSTWASVGGTGDPRDASPAEQTARAQALYARGGASQWGCGKHLFD